MYNIYIVIYFSFHFAYANIVFTESFHLIPSSLLIGTKLVLQVGLNQRVWRHLAWTQAGHHHPQGGMKSSRHWPLVLLHIECKQQQMFVTLSCVYYTLFVEKYFRSIPLVLYFYFYCGFNSQLKMSGKIIFLSYVKCKGNNFSIFELFFPSLLNNILQTEKIYWIFQLSWPNLVWWQNTRCRWFFSHEFIKLIINDN